MHYGKRTALAIVVALAVTAVATAQPYFGARVPIGYVTADVENLDEDRFVTGIEGVGGLAFGNTALEAKVGFVSHVYSVEFLGETVSAYLNYTRFALLGKLQPAGPLYLGAGVEFSYLVGAGVSTDGASYDQQIDAQDGPIFLALEGGLALPFGPNLTLPIGAFFNFAVGNIPDDSQLIELGIKAGLTYSY